MRANYQKRGFTLAGTAAPVLKNCKSCIRKGTCGQKQCSGIYCIDYIPKVKKRK